MIQTRMMSADRFGVEAARQALADGQLVAFPTETVYGLGADAANAHAVAALYAAKERPAFNPLIAHVASLEAAEVQACFSTVAHTLGKAFWPGPLTLVLPVAPHCSVCDLARAGLGSVAIRVPEHRIASDLLYAFGRPVVAPSANRSGRISPTSANHVLEELDGRIDLILDGGASQVGVESTIVSCLDDSATLLRTGGVTREALEEVLGIPVASLAASTITAPGQLTSHYAPQANMRLNATDYRPDEVLLGFGPQAPDATALNLSPSGNLQEAAANLFDFMRLLDARGTSTLAVMPIPAYGLGAAINDRLQRAAAPRQ
jgi:L-threonylcarbamoyladenylate synthase